VAEFLCAGQQSRDDLRKHLQPRIS
jgi:hypothetical protein